MSEQTVRADSAGTRREAQEEINATARDAIDNEPETFQLDFASVEDFKQTKIVRLLEIIDTLEFYALDLQFSALAKEALVEDRHGAYRAYRLLMVVCSFHFSVDRQDVFGPRLVRDGMRTPIPADIAGEQSEVLSIVADTIDHPLLRARVADVAWYNHRRLHTSAALAIKSYCQAIEYYLDDRLSFRYEPPSGLSAKVVNLLDRVFQIIATTGKRKTPPEIAVDTWKVLYLYAVKRRCYRSFDRLARLGQAFKLIEWTHIAHDAEKLAKQAKPSDHPMTVKDIWELAALAHHHSKSHDEFKRCKLKSIKQTLKMREGIDSNLAKASWTRDAIRELRSVPGMQKELEALKAELLEQQAQAAHEFSPFHIPVDLSEERQGTIDVFKNITLPEFFYRFALICEVPEKIALHTLVIRERSSSFLSDLFNGRVYTDPLGRVINQAPTINLNETPPPEWYDHESLTHLAMHYHLAVEGRVKPAAQTVMTKFALDDRHLMAIVSASQFVQPGFDHIYALGLARFFQGDMMSACHLLFPQLENSLRHVLSDAGIDTSKLDEEMLQEDRSLSGLLNNRRDDLESVFGVDLIYTIDLLFNLKGGPCLRHEMAHGKLASSACYLPSSIYACWLMYYLVSLPLLRSWKTHVAPQLELLAL